MEGRREQSAGSSRLDLLCKAGHAAGSSTGVRAPRLRLPQKWWSLNLRCRSIIIHWGATVNIFNHKHTHTHTFLFFYLSEATVRRCVERHRRRWSVRHLNRLRQSRRFRKYSLLEIRCYQADQSQLLWSASPSTRSFWGGARQGRRRSMNWA